MARRLLVAGSNSGYQLGVGHNQDVRTFQEALCRINSDGNESTPFPTQRLHCEPNLIRCQSYAGFGGAASRSRDCGRSEGKQIWIAGTGEQGQLGPGHAAAIGSKPVVVFTRLNLAACLDGMRLSEDSVELSKLSVAGNCSYIVLTPRRKDRVEVNPNQDVLISLGFCRDNTFGELGRPSTSDVHAALSGSGIDACVHHISFAKAFDGG